LGGGRFGALLSSCDIAQRHSVPNADRSLNDVVDHADRGQLDGFKWHILSEELVLRPERSRTDPAGALIAAARGALDASIAVGGDAINTAGRS
jgi:hypothetical protein